MVLNITERAIYDIVKDKRKYSPDYYEFRAWLCVGRERNQTYKGYLFRKHKGEYGDTCKHIWDKEFDYFIKYLNTIPPFDKDYIFKLAGQKKSNADIKKEQRRTAKKARMVDYNDGSKDFYKTEKWVWIAKKVKTLYGRKCMKCGTESGAMHADHIRPRSLYPSLEFDIMNIQVLCAKCNMEKGNSEEIDYRSEEQLLLCSKRLY